HMDLSDVSAMLDQTDSVSSPSNAAIMAALEHVVGRLHTLEAAVNELLKRSEPRSSCIFCPVADNRDGHNTSRCNRFPDAVAKSMQVARLGLCGRCLKPAHDDEDCGVQCAACGRPHNVLLCANRGQGGGGFKRRRP
ncbi:hypothetical protein V3C99_016069, partial [Haemonchus contortus]